MTQCHLVSGRPVPHIVAAVLNAARRLRCYVLEAAFVPVADAVGLLAEGPWHWPTVSYLRGEIEPGTLMLERRDADGSAKRFVEPAR